MKELGKTFIKSTKGTGKEKEAVKKTRSRVEESGH